MLSTKLLVRLDFRAGRHERDAPGTFGASAWNRTFKEGTRVLGTANVVNGAASLNVLGLSVGAHTIVATYSGDANNTPSSTSLTANIYDLKWLPAILQLLLDD